MLELIAWLTGLPLSLAIRRSTWLIPLAQTIHILAVGVVMSSVFMMDLRAWGYARSQTLAQSAHRFGPWIWAAMVPMIATGIALVLAAPRRTLLDPAFQVKILLMPIAIALTIALQMAMRRTRVEAASAGPITAVIAAAALLLWLVVTLAGRGRWIGNILR
jgi:uncharacterized membrane protein